jgi:exodeoxyribonuclease VII large subunit
MSRIARGMHHALAVRAQRADLAARGLVHPRARLATQSGRVAALATRAGLSWNRDAAIRGAALRALSARLRRESRTPPREALVLRALCDRWQRGNALLLARFDARLRALAQNLAHLSPQHVLERGYAIVTRAGDERGAGDVVQNALTLARGDAIELQFASGRAGATVNDVEP